DSGGGGIFNHSGSTLNARNTILAVNTAPNVPATNGPDLNGAMNSQGFNFVGNRGGTAITPALSTDQVGTPAAPIDPLLGPLQDNGGSTPTRALLAGSPVLDKGHSSGANSDQRGYLRPI